MELRDTWQRQSLPQQGGEIWGLGTRGSTGAQLSKKTRSRAKGHVTAPQLTSARRRGPEPRDTWQCRAHLSKEAMSEAEGHMAAPELTSARRRGLRPRDT
jgi:hypothetical protein